jgi:uncharacterized membrane protein HdeD (DUF308 family)
MLIVSIVSLVAGVILLFEPSKSLATLAVIIGIFLLLDGIVELVRAIGGATESRGVAAILGVLGIIVGVILIRHPSHAVAAIGLVFGLWLIAAGVVRLVGVFIERRHPVLRAAIAAIEILLGIVIVAQPHIGYTTLAIIAGICLILNGGAYGFLAFAMRRAKSELEHSATVVEST